MEIKAAVYNSIGEKVKELYEGKLPKGEHKIYWNGTSAANSPAVSGIYYIRVESLSGGVKAVPVVYIK